MSASKFLQVEKMGNFELNTKRPVLTSSRKSPSRLNSALCLVISKLQPEPNSPSSSPQLSPLARLLAPILVIKPFVLLIHVLLPTGLCPHVILFCCFFGCPCSLPVRLCAVVTICHCSGLLFSPIAPLYFL
jgi:hypothetical protein